jgi:hypothetical protein
MVDFTIGVSTAISLLVPGLIAVGTILWLIPLLGLIVCAGVIGFIGITVYLNRKLGPRFTELQDRERSAGKWYNEFLKTLVGGSSKRRDEGRNKYLWHIASAVDSGIGSWSRYAFWDGVRSIMAHGAMIATLVIGGWYIAHGYYGLGYFLVFPQWVAKLFEYLSGSIQLHKQWLDVAPAFRDYFAEIDAAERESAERTGAAQKVAEKKVLSLKDFKRPPRDRPL